MNMGLRETDSEIERTVGCFKAAVGQVGVNFVHFSGQVIYFVAAGFQFPLKYSAVRKDFFESFPELYCEKQMSD